MFGNFINFFKKISKENKKDSKDTAKERLHLVLMQDRANVSADFMELMKQEIIEVIKKYIDIDENAIDVKLTNKVNGDGTTGAPILYANIPILNVKDDTKQINIERNKDDVQEEKKEIEKAINEDVKEDIKEDKIEEKEELEENSKEEIKEEPKKFLELKEYNDKDNEENEEDESKEQKKDDSVQEDNVSDENK